MHLKSNTFQISRPDSWAQCTLGFCYTGSLKSAMLKLYVLQCCYYFQQCVFISRSVVCVSSNAVLFPRTQLLCPAVLFFCWTFWMKVLVSSRSRFIQSCHHWSSPDCFLVSEPGFVNWAELWLVTKNILLGSRIQLLLENCLHFSILDHV